MSEVLKFGAFGSAAKVGFWANLGKRKLSEWRLDSTPKEMVAHWRPAPLAGMTPRLEFSDDPDDAYEAQGVILTPNSLEEFARVDKNALLKVEAEKIFSAIESGACLEDPSLLVRFVGVVFCDHKRNRYVHWFGFPAVAATPPVRIVASSAVDPALLEVAAAFVREEKQFAFGLVFDGSWRAVRLSELKEPPAMFACVDGSGVPEEPGWPARNLLALISRKFDIKEVKVLCYRQQNSFVMDLAMEKQGCDVKAVGWELNLQGKLGPRSVELASLTDPAELAAQAASLNLQLMRWRLLPDLQLDQLAATKCLLLGAGTLGCAVARCLVGWGVRHLTVLDNGLVSYSNPARQSLYTYEDCGNPKAECAIQALKKIAPPSKTSPANYTAVALTIPMPGHALPSDPKGAEAARAELAELESLVASHDVVYLLTDTREARWLPTLLAKKHGKMLLNVALGLDTFLVQRHGVFDADEELGCYFCNDVVAPTDSTKERTMDQQCTVSRPGLAPIAGALAVELTVGLLHHPLKARAPADKEKLTKTDNPLGLLPHSIRGFLTHYSTMLPATAAFERCTACSKKVVKRYTEEGFAFVQAVAADPSLLEVVTGLDALKLDVAGIELNDDDEDDF